MKIIESIDFLGKKPTLLIASQESDKSFFGGILSLITFFGLLTAAGYFASIMLNRKTFTLIPNQIPDFLQSVNLTNFPVGVNILNSRNGAVFKDQERIFNVYLSHQYFKPIYNETLNLTHLSFEQEFIPLYKCNSNENMFPEEYKFLLENETYYEGYCLPPNVNISLKAPLSYPNNSFITFYFARCQNYTGITKSCLPPHIIDDFYLKNFVVSSFFLDFYFDHNNLNNPAIPYIRREKMFASSSSQIYKQMTVYMKNVEYLSDENFFYSNPNSINYGIFDSIKDETTLPPNEIMFTPFTQISFQMGSIKQSYERKFYKIQDMLADFGGVMNALLTITMQINLYFSNKTFFNKVIDANLESLRVESLKKQLNVVSEKIEQFMIDKCKNKEEEIKTSKSPKTKENFIIEQPENEKEKVIEKSSPEKLLLKNKSLYSADLMLPKQNEISVRSIYDEKDVPSVSSGKKNFTPKTNIELVKFSNNGVSEENQMNPKTQNHANLQPSLSELIKGKAQVNDKKFKINFVGYLFPAICFKKNSKTFKQLELHSKLTEIINENLDILNISKKIHTIDKLNYIICGDEFRSLLEKTSNPYLYQGDLERSEDISQARIKIVGALKLSDDQ